MQFRLENPEHQKIAIHSVVEVFRGMEKNTYDNSTDEDIRANYCSLSPEELHANLQKIIVENNISLNNAYLQDSQDACIEMETGTGKNEDTLGNLIVKYKDNTVGVGSGFSDEQRHEIWNNKDNYIGRIAEVRYKDITHDKTTGKESLQFPTFVQFREEGKEISYA